MPAELRIGVVGCGYWGPNLARNFAGLPGVTLSAVCDSRTERLTHMRSLHPGARAFEQADDFIRDGGCDAVAIATGASSHFAMAAACLRAGKHVCVEKPLALRTAECDELIRLAAERSLVLMVGHSYLYAPAMRKVQELIAAGEIGEVRHVSARRLNLGIVQRDINVVWDLAPHDISILLAIFGELPRTVNCQGASNLRSPTHDVASLWLSFSGNRSATVHNSWLNPLKIREIGIVGSRKMIVYDDVATPHKIRVFSARVEAPPHFDTFAEFQCAYHYGDVFSPHVFDEEPLKVECQHFVDCVRHGSRPLTGGEQGRDVVRVLEAADQSLAMGGAPVWLSPAPVSP